MEDINITGADFGSNLPKWATDETLRRLKRVIENDSARDKKDQQKIIGLLGKIVSADKSNANINKQIITELKSLNKTIASSAKSNKTTATKQSPSDAAHNKAVEDLLKKANSNLESIKNNVNQQAPTSSSNNSKQNTSDNKDFSRAMEQVIKRFSDNTDNSKPTDNKDLIQGIGKIFSNNTDESGDTKKTNDTLGLITAILGKSNKEIERLTGVVSSINTSGADKLKRIGKGSLENRVEEATAGKRKDDILKSVENILNKAGGQLGTKSVKVGKQAGKLASAIGGVAKFALKFGKMIPVIGTVITALSSLSAIVGIVVESGKKYAWDVQKEYRGMLKSGFSFGIETIEKGVKMDGIRLHKMINTAGVAVADGIALMEKNAVLVNNLGVDGVFNTIAKVAEYTNEAGVTFENQLMLSRQEIGEFTTQYLASSMNLLSREKLREENREKAARKYITDVMQFGQVTGQGMQVIIDRMNTLRQTSDFKLAMESRTGEQQETLETALTLTSSLNLDPSMIEKLNTILMGQRGLGFAEVEGGVEIRNALERLVSGSGSRLDELFRKVQIGEITSEQYKAEFANVIDFMKSKETDKVATRQIAIADNANEKSSAHILNAFRNMDSNVLRNGPTGSEKSSELSAAQAAAENQINLAKTVLEGIAINAADDESARNAMKTTVELMGKAAETGADVTVSLLSNILSLLTWSMDKLVTAVSKIASWSFFGGNEEKDKRDAFLDKIAKSESTVEESLLINQISKESGVEVEKTFFGGKEVLATGRRSNKALEEHANTLIARIEQGDNEAVQLYKDMAASKHLYDYQRDIYRRQLEKRMEEDTTAENKIISAFDNHKPTTYKQPVPNEIKPQTTTVAPVAQQVNDAVQAKTDYEERKRIELEEKRVEEERKRQENLEKAKREEAQQNNSDALVVTPETNTQAVQVANSSGEIAQVSTGINSLNSKLDELIRVQKEFNNNMVIQIIRA